MQMVKDMEENILRTFLSLKILYVVDNQSVDALVEMEKAVCGTFRDSGRILALEKTGGDIKHARLRVLLFYTYAYCLNKVRFTYTRRTENKKRVECLDCRIVGNRFAYGSRNLVTLTEAVVLECIAGVKLRFG